MFGLGSGLNSKLQKDSLHVSSRRGPNVVDLSRTDGPPAQLSFDATVHLDSASLVNASSDDYQFLRAKIDNTTRFLKRCESTLAVCSESTALIFLRPY